MKRGILIINRGSRETGAPRELKIITEKVRIKGGYDYADFCFLEVLPPFISDAMKKCPLNDLDTLTIVPYFLYPGRKIKVTVTNVMKYQKYTKTKFLVTKQMSMHPTMVKLVDNRIVDALKRNNYDIDRDKTDVLIVAHGSSDINAQRSINYVVEQLKDSYRNVNRCYLEIEQPDIPAGVEISAANNPSILVVVFYFLHEGAHVKRDVNAFLQPALEKLNLKNACITRHIGVDDAMIDLILERASEVEHAD